MFECSFLPGQQITVEPTLAENPKLKLIVSKLSIVWLTAIKAYRNHRKFLYHHNEIFTFRNIEYRRHWPVSKASQISIKKVSWAEMLKKIIFIHIAAKLLRVNCRHFLKRHLKRYIIKNKYSSPIMDVKLSFYYLMITYRVNFLF